MLKFNLSVSSEIELACEAGTKDTAINNPTITIGKNL
jgi:hypothetical protein